jgi:hypothetical protein
MLTQEAKAHNGLLSQLKKKKKKKKVAYANYNVCWFAEWIYFNYLWQQL